MQTIVATLIPDYPNIEQMIMFSLLGFAVVMIVLMVLSGITSFVGIFFKSADKIKSGAAKRPSEPAAKTSVPDEHAFVVSAAVAAVLPELRDEQSKLIAILSAATAAVIEDEHRILSFRRVPDAMAYARQGRMQIYASKNFTPARFK